MRPLTSIELTAVHGGNFIGLAADALCGCAVGAIASLFIDAPKMHVILSSTILFVGFYGLTSEYY